MLAEPHISQATTPGISERDRRWLLEDLSPMGGREAAAKTPWLRGHLSAGMVGGRVVIGRFFYWCRHFDPATRTCASHDDLPSACKDYPWRDDPPHPAKTLPPQCGYNVDVGRVPVELTVGPRPGVT